MPLFERFLLSGCTFLTFVPSVRFFVGTAVLEAHLIYVGLLPVPLGSPTAWRPLVFLQTQSQQPAATRKHRGLSEKIRWGPSIWRVSNARLVGNIGWKSWGDEEEWEIAQSSFFFWWNKSGKALFSWAVSGSLMLLFFSASLPASFISHLVSSPLLPSHTQFVEVELLLVFLTPHSFCLVLTLGSFPHHFLLFLFPRLGPCQELLCLLLYCLMETHPSFCLPTPNSYLDLHDLVCPLFTIPLVY